MKLIELLGILRKNNIKMWVENNNLHFDDPNQFLSEDMYQNLNDKKQEIISLFKDAKQTKDDVNNKKIVKQVKPENIPLSFAQQRLWFMEQLQPGTSFYNIQDVRQLEGRLNISALEWSINEIVRRHESMRTTFNEVDGEPIQVILEKMIVPLNVIDLSELHFSEAESRLDELINEDAIAPFNLSECLFRAIVIQLSDEKYILILSMHHIVSDGWSMGILFNELGTLYEAYCNQSTSNLSELEVQYADYAIWQRKHLNGEKLQQELAYWRNHLSGAPSLIELPTTYTRQPVQSYKGNLYSIWFPGSDIEELERICKENGATLYMGLLAIYKILLFKYSGQRDLVVGTVTANRNSIELEDIIGFFVNTLPIRSMLDGNPLFNEFLKIVRDSCLGAYAHQEVPFEMVVDNLKPVRNLSYTPIVQTLCILQSASENVEIPSLKTSRVEVEYNTSKFDLTLAFEKNDNGMLCHIEYNTDLFDEATISRLMNSYKRLLKGVSIDQNKRISDLQILSNRETSKILELSSQRTNYELETSIHEWFEQQVSKNPDNLAISFKQDTITYRELNERSNQMANFLLKKGVTLETRVGICVERSIDMLIAIIATLKVGGTYVPIDPNYPAERIRYILHDSNSKILISNQHLINTFEDELELDDLECMALESSRKKINKLSIDNLELKVSPSNAAYIIYTSGSTGKPKGVMVTHLNVMRLFKSAHNIYEFNENDKWTLFHSFAFDFSVWEIWGALFYGGQLVVVPYWVSRSIDDFYSLVSEEEITILNQTPSAFNQFIEADKELNKDLNLRFVIFGGETLEFNKLENWFNKHGDCTPKLINMYGITETTVHVTHREVKDSDEGDKSLIGNRLPDLELYILDDNMNPVPKGVIGEIYVGGAGVSRGYNNLPRMTAERYVPNIYNIGEPGSRLYRTGDLGRWINYEDIEYIGRIDHQVKIRGFRIELDEIQKTLENHPSIQQVLITTFNSSNEDVELVAYFTLKIGQDIQVSALKDYLSVHLPTYMIPKWLVRVDEFKLNHNGKVDRDKLPKPTNDRISHKQQIVLPRTKTEETISLIWKEILGVEYLSIFDNFFELGGHSFNAIQLIRKIEKSLNKFVPTSYIFQYPTIQGMSAVLDAESTSIQKKQVIELQSVNSKNTLALIHPVGGTIFCYTKMVQLLSNHHHIVAFESPGLDGREKPLDSIVSMANKYVNELLATNKTDYTLLGWSMGGNIAFEMGLQIYKRVGIAPTIIMIDSWNRELMPLNTFKTDAFNLFLDDLTRSINIDLDISKYTGDTKFEKLVNTLKEIGNPFSSLSVEDLQNYFNVYKANLDALNKYVPLEKYHGEISLLRAEENNFQVPALGWENLSDKSVSVKVIPGDHYTVLNQPSLNIIVKEVEQVMDKTLINSK
ncbi:amino acid adenylation domain-containing protein [Cytobacillus horneckiae]|uniref:amino acid adenylation domain-containing protein n=1 Tax=Cytobacillus horneckiae TaxID=549687 RepID=UPI0039A2AAD2